MRTTIYWVILSEILNSFGLHTDAKNATNRKQTFLNTNKYEEIFLQRSKRYLKFEKGASVTFQGNMAKSIIMPSPRGLNLIAEYTLSYELPTDLKLFEIERKKLTKAPSTTTSAPLKVMVPYSHDYSQYLNLKSSPVERNYIKKERLPPQKCLRQNFYYTYRRQYKALCLKRFKRYEKKSVDMTKLSVSQRMFYDLIEKWSLLHGFLPRYCFMRTLCESSQLLLPYGQSLLHDAIHILLRYTKTWAFHHEIFGRSLRQRYSIDECAKLYGPYCRVSWLNFITNAIYGTTGGSRSADFKRR